MAVIEQCLDADEDHQTPRNHANIEPLDAQTEELAVDDEGYETAGESEVEGEGEGNSNCEEQRPDASKQSSCEEGKPTEEQLQQVNL